MKYILLLLLLISPFTCKKNVERSTVVRKIYADINQIDFYNCIISIYEQGKMGKIYLPNFPVKIAFKNKTYNYVTDSKGEILINIPEEIATNIEDIFVYVDHRRINLKYIAPVIKENLKVDLNFINYYHFILSINKVILKSKWPPGSPEFIEEYLPISQEIEVNLNNLIKKVAVKSGIVNICLTKEEAINFWDNPTVCLFIQNQKFSYNFTDFKPDGSFFFIYKEIGTNYFSAKIQNRRLEAVEAEVIAGYKENEEWLTDNYLGIDYFRKQLIKFEPGETKDISFYYKVPNKSAKKDVSIAVINQINFTLNNCE